MAIIGEAYIVIKPISSGFEAATRRELQKLEGVASGVGRNAGAKFSSAFSKNLGALGVSSDFANKIESQGKALYALQSAGIGVGTVISELLGSVAALAGGVVALGSALLSAAPAALALGAGLVDIGIGAITAKLALSGVGKAVTALNKQKTMAAASDSTAKRRVADAEKALLRVVTSNTEALTKADKDVTDAKTKFTKAQEALTTALKDGNEQLQQMGFDAEDAALAEKRAGLDLEKAREALARVQDLPPNSRARREAQLAYAEADLNLRRAKDKNSDLAKQQTLLAKTGVDGLDSVVAAREAAAQADSAVADARDARSKAEVDALTKQKDAEEALRRAQEDAAKGRSGGSIDPLAGLTASQAEFAKFISGLQPELKKLKEAAAGALLPPLQTAITTLVDKAFPTLKTGLKEVGSALGNAAIKFTDAFTSNVNLDKLSTVFTNAATAIDKIGSIGGNLWGVFLSVLQAVDPLLQKFLDYLNKTTKSLDEKLNADPEKLKAFFAEAGRVAAEVGKIISNIAGGLGNIIKANTGPGTGGQIMLDYFKDITGAFKAFSGSEKGQNQLKDYFAGAAENTKSILSSVGGFVKQILILGADPNVKKFWDTIGKAAEPFGSIMKKTNEGAPALASLVVTITKIIDALTNTSTIKTFFGTFDVLAKVVLAILNNKVIKAILNFTAPFHGIALALTAVSILFSTFGAGLLFLVLKPLSMLMNVFKIFKGIIEGFRIAWTLLTFAFSANPIGVIVVAIIALVAAFVILYKKNEAFRELVQKVWAAIKDAIGVAVDAIAGFFNKIIEFGGKLWGWIFDGLKFVWDRVFAYFETVYTVWKTVVEIIVGIGLIIWDFLYDKIVAVWTKVSGWWNVTILPFITGVVTSVAQFGAKIWDWIYDKLSAVWAKITGFWNVTIYPFVLGIARNISDKAGSIWNFISGGISTAWNKVTGFFSTTIYPFIMGIKNTIANLAAGMWDGLKNGLSSVVNFIIRGLNLVIRGTNVLIRGANAVKIGKDITLLSEIAPVAFAKGGIVQPSFGGTIARIGEAGRAERVEPLDSNGLSKRDKAMIELLAGGKGGNTINVYPSPGMNESELASMVSRQIAFQMRKGGS